MTGERPPPDVPPAVLEDACRWCERLAAVAADVGRRVRLLAEQVATDWPDARGREWANRAAGAGAELQRAADSAAELGATYARQAAALLTAAGGAGAALGRPAGMRLGGTAAARVEDEHGMRIAELTDPRPSA